MTPAPAPGFLLGNLKMQSLDKFMPRLLPWVTGCPVPLAQQELVRSAIAFCEETNAICTDTGPINIVVGGAEYDSEIDFEQELTRVMGAWLGDTPIGLLGPGHHSENNGHAVGVRVSSMNTVTLVPTPDAQITGQLRLRVATRPKITAKRLDDTLLNKWSEGVVFGAIARLAALPGQPFSDLTQAQSSDVHFWRAVNRARIESRRGEVASSLRVRSYPLA